MTGVLQSKYVLGELIGTGRSGSVYRVHPKAGGPQLAIQVLSPLLAEDPDVIARARHLRSSLRSLRNPHLVAVNDVVIEPDILAIVSEYVDGGSLGDYLAAQPRQSEATALSLVHQVLAGLAFAHGHGYFHGHLTAQQVLLAISPSGEITAKVSDLATVLLARAVRIDDDPDACTDLHAAGVLLHEMLTGEPPVIRRGQIQPTLRKPAAVSPAAWSVVTTLLACDDVTRPTDTWKALSNVEQVMASLGPDEWRPLAADSADAPLQSTSLIESPSHASHLIVLENGALELAELDRPAVVPALNLLPADYDATAFDITGAITPVFTPSITNLPVLPERAGGLVSYVPPEPRKSRWTRTRIFVALACVALGGICAGLILSVSGGGTKNYFLVDTSTSPGLETTRTWTLTGGKHPTLHVLLEFATSTKTSTQVEEVLPTSLLADASSVTFRQPQPTHLDGNHVVSYTLNTNGPQLIDAFYDVAVPPKDFSMAALLGWSDEQRNQAGERYRATHALTSISLPKRVYVTIGRTIALPLTGVQQGGAAAPSTALGGATYRVDDTGYAKIGSDGVITGLKIGHTSVHVTLGNLTASATVYVIAPTATKAAVSTPLQAPVAVTTSAAAQGFTTNGDSTTIGTSNNNGAAVGFGAGNGPTTKAPTTTPTTPSTPTRPSTRPTTTPTRGGGTGSGGGGTSSGGGGGGGSTTPPTTTPTQPTTAPTQPPSAPPSTGGGATTPPEFPPVIGGIG